MAKISKAHKLKLDANTVSERRSVLSEREPGTGLIRILTTIVVIVLAVVTVFLQVGSGSQSAVIAESNIGASVHTQVPRGLFYDRNSRKLVTNEQSYSLYLSKSYYLAHPDTLKAVVGDIGGQVSSDLASVQALLTESSQDKVLIAHGLSAAQALIIKDRLKDKKYELATDTSRHYVYPYLYSQIIGYTGIPNLEELKAGHEVDDLIGKYRLEKILDSDLSGTPGLEVKQAGNVVTQLPGVPGDNVFLTIDTDWQQALYMALGNQVDALGAKSGSAVIVDSGSGDIWAYVSYPTYDPNIFSGNVDPAEYNKLLTDPRTPLLDKVISLQASPGSVFKLVAAYAGLENGVIDENTHIYSNRCISLGGYPFCEYGKFFFGDLDIKRALTRSSNIFFCDSILKLKNEQSYDKYVDAARALGIGQKTGIILENELSGIIPTPENKLKIQGEKTWYDGDICNSVIGQGISNVTPLQMAMLFSTIYNGGTYYVPNVIDRIEDQNGNIVRDHFQQIARQIPISTKTRDLITAGMYNVVHSWEGTAYRFLHAAPGNFLAKTGSAEAYEVVDGKLVPRVNGWIVGKFDYNGKSFAFAAQMQFAGGGWNVTQVMQRFANCLYSNFAFGCQAI